MSLEGWVYTFVWGIRDGDCRSAWVDIRCADLGEAVVLEAWWISLGVGDSYFCKGSVTEAVVLRGDIFRGWKYLFV